MKKKKTLLIAKIKQRLYLFFSSCFMIIIFPFKNSLCLFISSQINSLVILKLV